MKKKKITVAVISAISALTLMLGIVPSLAKYVTEHGKQSEVVSDNFYFTSDYLSESAIPEYKICGDSVSFEIRNYIDSYRVNASDIVYTVTALDGTLSPVDVTLSPVDGRLNGGTENGDSDIITLTYSGDEVEKEITVTVRSSSPYVKELKAKFVFIKPVLRYEITDSVGSYYAELYIHTANDEKTVKVNWDKTELLIDETNDYVFEKLYGEKNSVSVSIPAHTTVKIAFFKNDITKNYSCGATKFDGTITMPSSSTGSKNLPPPNKHPGGIGQLSWL